LLIKERQERIKHPKLNLFDLGNDERLYIILMGGRLVYHLFEILHYLTRKL